MISLAACETITVRVHVAMADSKVMVKAAVLLLMLLTLRFSPHELSDRPPVI